MSVLRRVNWSLWLGLLLVAMVFALAAVGPTLAPLPTPNFFAMVGTESYRPPFPPLTIPGYPLGSDALGRNVWHQLLWAIRPTVQVLLLIAGLRLLLGAAIGLVAGWSRGDTGRAWDSLITAALAPPVLVVALLTVAALGDKLGIRAFVLGLCLTGWAETARTVREQSRLVRGQSYVEAARSLGASDLFVATQHVLRQLLPLLSVLAAFEISATLLTLGTLGFLGYYLGGNIWIDVSDTAALRASRLPELGQMLAGDSTEIFLGPWKMFAAGTAVAGMIFGFNLLGSGLQRAAEQHRFSYSPVLQTIYYAGVVAQALTWPVRALLRLLAHTPPSVRRAATVALLVMLAFGGWQGWRVYQARRNAPPPRTAFVASVLDAADGLAVPGSHLWVSDAHDPYGTRWSPVEGPTSTRVLWRYELAAGWASGPAVAADGTLFLAGQDNQLYAITASGEPLWQADLAAPSVGAPALGPDGTVYVADEAGAISAFAPDGTRLWRYETGEAADGTEPIVAPDGTLFQGTEASILALAPDGTLRWQQPRASGMTAGVPLLIDPQGQWLFVGERVVSTSDGGIETGFNVRPTRFLVGADGSRYYQQTVRSMMRWEMTERGFLAVRARTAWQDSGINATPRIIGVAPDGHIWYQADTDDEYRLAWRTPEGEPSGLYSLPLQRTRLIGLDREGTSYACGEQGRTRLVCVAVSANSTAERWNLNLPPGGAVMGGALVPSRLYVALEDGTLYAIGNR